MCFKQQNLPLRLKEKLCKVYPAFVKQQESTSSLESCYRHAAKNVIGAIKNTVLPLWSINARPGFAL